MPMRAPILALLLVLGVPAAHAQPDEADAGTPVLCQDSKACAIREGYGSVCEDGQCEPYQDKTDLFVAIGLSEKNEVPPQAYKPLLTVLPVIGSNPTQGALIG